MKKVFFSIRRNFVAASAILLSFVIFTACKKDIGNNNQIPVSKILAFNLTPDKSAVGIALSGNLLTNSALAYTNYTGGYLNIYPGDRSVESFDFMKDSAMASSNFNFEPNKYYSLFVTGNNNNYKNVIVKDDIDSLSSTSGKAYVRYMNAIPDSSAPTVTISANGSNIVNSAAAFSTASPFTGVNPGDINIAIANGASISANRTIKVESGRVYTVLLVGVPSATDSAKTVQIKYIQNGILTDEDQK